MRKKRTASKNTSFECGLCTAELGINNDAIVTRVKVYPNRLLNKLKSLASRGKAADAERLLNTLLLNTKSDSDNYTRVIKARDMFAEWLSKRR